MEENVLAPKPPDSNDRWLFAASLVSLFLSVLLWSLIYVRPYRAIYDSLGMTELPWLTGCALSIADGAAYMMPILALGLMIFGVVALNRATRKKLLQYTAANFILAVLYPGMAYFSVHMPLVDLQKKLGGGS